MALTSAAAIAMAGPPLALLGTVGSAIGTAIAGSAGVPITAEDPMQRGRVLILAALPMTQTFYGFIFMFMAFTHVLSLPSISLGGAYAMVALGLVVGLIELFSAIWQGKVCKSAIALLIKTRGAIMGMGLIMAVYVELFAILGMAFGIMALYTWVK